VLGDGNGLGIGAFGTPLGQFVEEKSEARECDKIEKKIYGVEQGGFER
jgi:hypothetical protein